MFDPRCETERRYVERMFFLDISGAITSWSNFAEK